MREVPEGGTGGTGREVRDEDRERSGLMKAWVCVDWGSTRRAIPQGPSSWRNHCAKYRIDLSLLVTIRTGRWTHVVCRLKTRKRWLPVFWDGLCLAKFLRPGADSQEL